MSEEAVKCEEIPVAAVENVESNGVPVKVMDEDIKVMVKEGKKDEDESNIEGDFIKVEKEAVEKPSVVERTFSGPDVSTELLESQEKVKDLEHELLRISGALKESESVNTHLKEELLKVKEIHQDGAQKQEKLELDHKKLLDQIAETEERYSVQLKTLQEALEAQEEKNKELSNVKEAYDGLSLELETSRKKVEALQLELQNSSGEAHKFEELHKQSGLHAESEAQKTLEFERLLELAKSSAKEMEDQMATLQGEVKSLYEKIAENEKVEEALKSVTSELSVSKSELELSKSQVQDVEKRLASKESLISELTQDLELIRASESKAKEVITSLESSVSSMTEGLQEKASQLEDISLKLKEAEKAKEEICELLRVQETKMKILEGDIEKVTTEKQTLKEAVADLTSNAGQMKELCNELEAKLQQSDENFFKADTLLSEAVANSKDLEEKLKILEELHAESGHAVNTTNLKNVELEGLIQSLNAAAEEAKSQQRESETRCITAEQRTVELEQLLNLEELKSHDLQRELRELSEKISNLNAEVEKEAEEKQKVHLQLQDFQAKLAELESELGKSTARNSELEIELKSAIDKCAEHEGRANTVHERSLELETLVQTSDSKAADSHKRATELELLIETEKYRIKELEEQISLLEKKTEESQAESLIYSKKASELEEELEAIQLKASSLEAALQASDEKEKELTGLLNQTTEENRELKVSLGVSNEKISEEENLINVLQNELNISQQRLESFENDIKASGAREAEVIKKLKLTEEQLEQQSKILEQLTARCAELESSHEVFVKDSDSKLQEAIINYTNRDLEAKTLHEKAKAIEDQVTIHQEKIAEATERYEIAKEELDQISLKLASSEQMNEELKAKISEAEAKAEGYISANAVLSETNVQLLSKVNDLEEKLTAAVSEAEVSGKQLASHVNTIADLTEKHSKVSEIHLAAEGRIVEAEAKLEEALQKFSLRDSEAKDLHEKLKSFDELVKTRELELERTVSKSTDLESELEKKCSQFEKDTLALVETNSKLSQDLAAYESKLSDLENKLSVVSSERDASVEEISNARKEVDELTKRLAAEGEKLQSQISSVMEENNLISETYQTSKKDLEQMIVQLEEQLKEQKSIADALAEKTEILTAEVAEKSELQNKLKCLQEDLATLESKFREEKSQREMEHEKALKDSLKELDVKKNKVVLLENQVKDLEHQLQLTDAKLKEKDTGAAEQKDEVIKSREIDLATTPRRKNKKKSEGTSAQALATETKTQSTETSPLMTLKIILGVALVSIVFGIILGKRY